MAGRVHLRAADGTAACGTGARWASCTITTIGDPGRVTCRRCRGTGADLDPKPTTPDEDN